MDSIRRFLREARRLDKNAFAERLSESVLVVEPHQESESESFNTLSPASASGQIQTLSVAPVRKRRGANTFANMVTIGRASNNDIQLRAAGISKFHAYIMITPDGHCELTDAKSSFGTWVNDDQIGQDGKVRLTCGAKLRLGELKATYYTPSGLYDYLLTAKDPIASE